MFSQLPSTPYVEDHALDTSTAPTTPDGSLTFSPILLPSRLQHALEIAEAGTNNCGDGPRALDTALLLNKQVRKVCCIGAGYVGGPTAAVMAFHNPHLNVTVVDRDATRIEQWKSKHLPIYEPGLNQILRVARDGSKQRMLVNELTILGPLESTANSRSASSERERCGAEYLNEIPVHSRMPNLFFSTEISTHVCEADIILIAVNTPTKLRGLGAKRATDMTALEAVAKEIAIHAKPGAILVEKSTVPCKTVDLIQDILKTYRPDTLFEVISNPEFLAAGTAIDDLLNPDRVIIGSASTAAGHRAAQLLASIYASWVPQTRIVAMNTYSSELTKLIANAMLAQRISSINSISAICEATGADVYEVAKGIGKDARIGSKYLKAGLGFGGSCFKKDILSLCYLADSLGLQEVSEYWEQVLKMNDFQRRRFIRRVVRCLNGTLVGKKLAVLGYAFKQNTSDTRESPALECIKELLEDAPEEIAVFDPFCDAVVIIGEIGRLVGEGVLKQNGGPITVHNDAYAACADSHAVLIMTECDYFRNSGQLNTDKSPLLSSQSIPQIPSVPEPRTFQKLEPTEVELVGRSRFLSVTPDSPELALRLIEEPACKDACEKCVEEERMTKRGTAMEKESVRLDWARIAYSLHKPRWVFDGRGVVDGAEMERLGVRLESVGRKAESAVSR